LRYTLQEQFFLEPEVSTCPCANCGDPFQHRPQNPDQTFCSKKECQRARKRRWQAAKRQKDADYRENQRQAQKRWREKNPDYWKRWRSSHPEYVERNRVNQRIRNEKRRRGAEKEPEDDASRFAKMDASTSVMPVQSGTYRLVPVGCKDGRVNAGFLCEISHLSSGGGDFR
jgi:endogenous inhibitor of DNA gyrase (YacG/DUF329 family)